MIENRPAPQTPQAIVFRTRQDDTVEVVVAPFLSSITVALLEDGLDQRWRDPDAPDVLVLPGGYRYLIGDLRPAPHERERLLHRLP